MRSFYHASHLWSKDKVIALVLNMSRPGLPGLAEVF